jgi:DNA-binding transcriptional LysR family regulator
VSHAIRGLEERLNVSLFNRTTRSVALTEAGEHLLSRLQPLLSDVGEVIDEMNVFGERPSGRLRINTSRLAAHLVIAPLMARFLAAYPAISLEVVKTMAWSISLPPASMPVCDFRRACRRT